MGLVALQHVGSSWTQDRIGVPCIAEQTLNHHQITREAPKLLTVVYLLPNTRNYKSYILWNTFSIWIHLICIKSLSHKHVLLRDIF